MANERAQQAVWTGAGVVFRTVREITTWDGRTVGVVRHDHGDHVVQYRAIDDRWDVLNGVSTADIRTPR